MAGQLDPHTRPAPDLSPWEPAWSTESPVEAALAVSYLEAHGIRARVSTHLKRHVAMNTVEFTQVSVPATEVGLATSLLEGRADLFPGSTSWSEPLRYRRGLWGRVSRAGRVAQIGFILFFVALFGPVVVVLIASALY